MSISGRKQEDESQEEYVRRISKFPALNPFTIQKIVFPTSSQVAWEYLHNWAGLVFPEEYPQTDWHNESVDYPESISTKAFAKWVVEEDIFEAWIALGEEVSSSARLFIDLVNRKAIDSKQASIKVRRKKPDIATDRGRLDFFKNETFIPLVEKVLKQNPEWQNNQVLAHSKVKDALTMSDLPKGTPSGDTIKKWICTARKNAGVKAKTGRPPE
jgi:hypothetical protein